MNNIIIKILQIFAFLLCTGLFLRELVVIMDQYLSKATTTGSTVETMESERLPTITLCPEGFGDIKDSFNAKDETEYEKALPNISHYILPNNESFIPTALIQNDIDISDNFDELKSNFLGKQL